MTYNDNETRKAIVKGQCLNIAFQSFDTNNNKDDIKRRVKVAHEIYNELMNENFLSW